MKKAIPPRKFGRRTRWLALTVFALLAPTLLLLPRGGAQQGTPRGPAPDVVRMVGPVSMDTDLRELPYIPPTPHDSWVVGDEPYVSLHLLGASLYAVSESGS